LKIVVVNNYKEDTKTREALENLARCTGRQIEMLDYKTRNLSDAVEEHSPDLVILTGSNFMLSKADTKTVFKQEMEMVKKLDLPYLGICFGHQLIGAAYGVEIKDLGHSVRAYKDVKLIDRDPVFEGLPSMIRVHESHRQALSELPREFRHLAESSTSRIEAIAHRSRPVYGVQFHPERSDDKNPHGRTLIQNFVKLVAKS
jgi:GMP synthase (glutamine-hydrolysing)